MLHVCICVKLRTGCSIRCFAIICQKLQLLESLAIFIVTLAIEHKRLGDFIIILAHKSLFHLVLNILYSDALAYIQVTEYLRDSTQVNWFIYRLKRLDNSVHYLI